MKDQDHLLKEIDRLAEENENLRTIEAGHKDLNGKLRKEIVEVENELALLKGIGNNSPEIRALQKRVKELEEDNKKLSCQIIDLNETIRQREKN